MKKQIALIILDGWGYSEMTENNAIAQANTPNFDRLWQKFPHTLLSASGLDVGLPDGQMGNSEVGHMTIGAGRSLDQDLVRIKKSIESGEFAKNPALVSLFEHVKKNNSTLHALGIFSPGGVHGHMDHLFAFLRAADNAGIKKVAIHVITDGRDDAPQDAGKHIEKLEDFISKLGIGFIATISGRSYAMDRDKNWDRTEKSKKAIFECDGNICSIKPSDYMKDLYQKNLGNDSLDEHIVPTVCMTDSGKGCAVRDGDGIFFWNFRNDRARQMSELILNTKNINNLFFATMTEYCQDYTCSIAFPSIKIDTTLAKEISEAGFSQAHIAETEKFPHATYFLNGGVEKAYPKEDHFMIESNKVKTHDLAPKMKAKEIADKTIECIEKGTDFIFVNIANPDMVGHTANVPAIIEAVEETDRQLGRIIEALLSVKGVAFITADHGNAELNIDPKTGEKHTSHTTNLVPAIFTDENFNIKRGTLADITPTILEYLEIKKPESMTGVNLISK